MITRESWDKYINEVVPVKNAFDFDGCEFAEVFK
jgi:uncharacterized protein YggL (DUF469 family)